MTVLSMDTGSPNCEVSDTQVSDPPVVLSYFNLNNTSLNLALILKKKIKPLLTVISQIFLNADYRPL